MTGRNQEHAPEPTSALRYEVLPGDRQAVRDLVESTGFFSPSEVDIAVELVDNRMARGVHSVYHFVLAEAAGTLVAFTCYGPIAGTESSFDLYWIAVRRDHQRRGFGRTLLDVSERRIRDVGGRRVYADTSNRPQYEPTRAFYERCGYRREALLHDFYAPGDAKVIYVKTLD